MTFDLECQYKKQMVEETINKIAKINVLASDTESSDEYNYRNKMVFPIANDGDKPVLGMFKSGTHNIVEIDECCICDNHINIAMQIIKKWLIMQGFNGYNFKNNTGDIVYVVLRYRSNQLLVSLVLNKEIEGIDRLYNELKNNFDSVGVSKIISNHKSDILDGKYTHLFGKDKIDINEFEISYSVDNRGFLQVNNDIKCKMYSKVLSEIDKNANVIDAYSGAGLMSAIIAKKCQSVVAIEINKSASSSAKELFLSNNISNATSICSDVALALEDNIEKLDNLTIVLDPPRSGCDNKILQLLNNHNKINKIIYISCNPSTLARDLSILKESYIIDSVIPYNMFPKTKHVETLVVLKRK